MCRISADHPNVTRWSATASARALSDDENFARAHTPESGAEIIRQIDLEEAAKERGRVEGNSSLSRFLATMRPCTAKEVQRQLSDYYWDVAVVLLVALLILLSPFFLASAFFVVRWVWRGFKPSTG